MRELLLALFLAALSFACGIKSPPRAPIESKVNPGLNSTPTPTPTSTATHTSTSGAKM